MNTRNDYTIESVQRALKVLKVFDCDNQDADCAFTMMEIVSKLGYNKSTVLRLLYTLQAEKFIRFDSQTKKYSLDVEMIRLGTSAKNSLNILKIAKPYLKELSANTRLVVYFALIYEDQIVIVDKIFPSSVTTIPYMTAQIGLPLPIYSSGIGRLYLGEKTEQEMRCILSKVNIVPFTQYTVTDVDKIIELAKEAHENGVAYCKHEHEDYVSSICYPIRDNSGMMVAGVSVGGVMEQVEGENKPIYEKHLADAASRISKAMGFRG